MSTGGLAQNIKCYWKASLQYEMVNVRSQFKLGSFLLQYRKLYVVQLIHCFMHSIVHTWLHCMLNTNTRPLLDKKHWKVDTNSKPQSAKSTSTIPNNCTLNVDPRIRSIKIHILTTVIFILTVISMRTNGPSAVLLVNCVVSWWKDSFCTFHFHHCQNDHSRLYRDHCHHDHHYDDPPHHHHLNIVGS